MEFQNHSLPARDGPEVKEIGEYLKNFFTDVVGARQNVPAGNGESLEPGCDPGAKQMCDAATVYAALLMASRPR